MSVVPAAAPAPDEQVRSGFDAWPAARMCRGQVVRLTLLRANYFANVCLCSGTCDRGHDSGSYELR